MFYATTKKKLYTLNEFNEQLDNRSEDLAETYKKFVESLPDYDRNEASNKSKLSEEVLDLIKERKQLYSKKPSSKENTKQITVISKKIKEGIRRHRKTKRFETFEKIILKTGGIKKALKELREDGTPWMVKMKKSGTTITKRKEIKELATDFYRSLYSNESKQETYKLNDVPTEEPTILAKEVKKAILSQKLDKAPGPDRIPNELLRGTIEEICPLLAKIFNNILKNSIIPKQWQEAHIILIHKKGDRNEIGNYRPISLISNIYKVYAKIILNRISNALDENQPVEQAGFRKDYSTIDHIHTVKQVLKKYNEYGKTIYLAFIDYTKAFDSLNHEFMWRSLKEQGISPTFIANIMSIYTNSKARIRLETIGNEFPVNKGIRQGDPLSPKLFSAALESIFRTLNWEEAGININGTRLNHLRFADDLVLFEENPKILEQMIQELSTESKLAGLEMNEKKTKLMTNSTEIEIFVNGKKLDFVQEYTYLGQTIAIEDQTTKEINTRIAAGWKKYWSLKEIMKNKSYSLTIKRKTFNTCILPCLIYGCETWALSKFHRDKLQSCQRAMERSMMNIRKLDKINNKTIRTKTKVTDILTKIDEQKWRWAGHTMRNINEKWSKVITNWYPRDGKRKKGRPAKRWEDEIRLTAGPYWRRAALDRIHWKELEEAFANRHTEIRDII